MDNCFTGRRDWSRQTSEKDVLYIVPAGPARRVHSPGGASYFLFLSRHRDIIASFSFGAWRVKTCFHNKQIFVTTPYTSILFHLKEVLQCYPRLCLLQDRDEVPAVTLWLGLTPTPSVHVVEIRGVGDDPCVLKKECDVCKGFIPQQIQQLSTPTYRDRKEKKATASSSAPTLVDPAHVSVLGKVEKVKASQPQSTPTTPKKTKRSESPKPSASKKKSSSSRPSADDLKQLDDKWAERFSRLEAMLLAKTFTVPVEAVVKPASDVTTSQKPFFDPGATTRSQTAVNSSPCLDQATGEAVDEMQTATQPLEAPSAGTATQPVQAPGSVPDGQPTGEGI